MLPLSLILLSDGRQHARGTGHRALNKGLGSSIETGLVLGAILRRNTQTAVLAEAYSSVQERLRRKGVQRLLRHLSVR